jgi:hypothetical protein
MKTLLTLLLSCSVFLSLGQTVITGTVVDKKGEGIPMASIFLLDTYDGTSSDAAGNFEFTTTETGRHILVVRFIGFKEYQQTIDLNSERRSLSIVLDEQINELKAVTITAGAFTASDESRRTVFRAVDIATTAGATADIAGALNTLPGTQKVGESGRLFVRGGDGNEARTFIDGLVVMNPYNPSAPNTPSRGRFLPFMFKRTSFSTGGYSAEYGQALSSALVLDSKDKAEMSRTDIGILSVGGDVAHTQAWKDGSVAAKVQYTNLRPYVNLIDQQIDWQKAPASVEASSAFRQRVGTDAMIKFFGNINQSNFSLYNHDIDNGDNKQLYDLTNDYKYLNAAYKDPLNERWLARGGLSYTSLANHVKIASDDVHESEKGIHAKAVLEGSVSDKIEIRSGAELLTKNYEYRYNASLTGSFDELIASAFFESDLYTSNNFVGRTGIRMEYNNLQQQIAVDPRISLGYKAGSDGQVSFAYGIFRQSSRNEFLRVREDLQSEKAEHFILNYQHIDNNRTFRIEGYYKRYSDLIKYTDKLFTDINNSGTGFARGIELFWRDSETLEHVDYWLSYSFLDTKRNYLNHPISATPAFASKHNFSAVYKYFITDIRSQLGMTWSFSSGRPYHDPNSGKFNTGRTPNYNDVSFNWSYLPKPYLILYFSCTNLLGRDNIFTYEYSNQLNEEEIYNARAVRQPAKRFVFIGIFITLSREKSVNQLPNL